jgi:alkylation response protein AidB-like acyl-CoA dehydrogenase
VTGLSTEERAIVGTVADWVDREVRPVVRDLEHANAYPDKLIEQMKQLGFGLAIPGPWGGAAVSMPCYALVTAELARGWMSLAGAMGGHTVVSKLLLTFGTREQQDKYLPRMATGEIRATKVTAARQLILYAAERFETGQRCDMEAGMAKLFASEVAMEVALNAVRIHGGYGYSTEYDVERYYRDAPLMIVGEGTNEIQRNVIAGQLVKRGGLDRT